MKHLLTLLLATLCATSYGQTIKSLGYNTSGQVVYAGTNVLSFSNQLSFGSDLILNNANGALFFYDLDGSKDIFVFDGGEVDASRARTNLGLGATWLTNDNVTNFRTAIGLGATNDVTFQSVYIEGESFQIASGTNQFFYAGSDVVEIFVPVNLYNQSGLSFQGTNAAAAASATRTNLGIPLPALTNTNNFNTLKELEIIDAADSLASGFAVDRALVVWDNANDDWGFLATDNEWRTRAGFGDTNAPTNTTNAALWINVIVGTNAYKLPLYQ